MARRSTTRAGLKQHTRTRTLKDNNAADSLRSTDQESGMGSSFGDLFRISTFGESHGGGVGVIVDGCPPRLALDLDAIQAELDRRKPGQSKITTPRKEADQVEILSGLLDGETLGTPIAMVVRNKDQRPQDYKEMEVAFRPSHADATLSLIHI